MYDILKCGDVDIAEDDHILYVCVLHKRWLLLDPECVQKTNAISVCLSMLSINDSGHCGDKPEHFSGFKHRYSFCWSHFELWHGCS